MKIHPDAGSISVPLAPRLFFEEAVLWEMAGSLREGGGAGRYSEALGVVIACQLPRILGDIRRRGLLARGGLAVWQQPTAASHVQQYLADPIPVAALAKRVKPSPFHFCQSFKQASGVAPHRYHSNRRIEPVKTLLSDPAPSVTDIADAPGFSATSSFSRRFDTTGSTPTEYRRTRARSQTIAGDDGAADNGIGGHVNEGQSESPSRSNNPAQRGERIVGEPSTPLGPLANPAPNSKPARRPHTAVPE